MKNNLQTSLARCVLTLALGLSVAAIGSAQTSPLERVWQLKLAGEPSGTFTESTVVRPDKNVATKESMALELNRLGKKVEMKTSSESVEDSDGTLESLEASVSSSQATTHLKVQRVEGALDVTTEAGGKSYQKKIPLNGPVVGPKGVEKLSRENLKAKGDKISYQVFSPELGNVVSMTRQAVGREGSDNLLRVEEAMEGMPGQQIVLLDEQGRWIRRQQTLPFGELVMEPANAAAASPSPAQAKQPTESYDQTMARSNIPLPDPRTLTRVTLRLRHQKPELGWPDLGTPRQRVLEKSHTIRVIEVSQSPTRGAAAAAPDETYLQPNPLVQSDDPEVIRIAQEVTANVTDDFEKARRLQDWVNKNLDFDLGIVLAPASEVVRNRRGTCVAYAILLAALERAAGLPSRIAMGYAYASGIWGGHAWTEVFIGGKWIPLDAALYSPGPADAARLWFGASNGSDQMLKPLAAGAQMYGSVDFDVVSFEQNGRTTKVPENAERYQVEGQRYTNPWLGFTLESPAQFRFTNLDAVFPERTIVALEGPGNARISVRVSSIGADAAAIKDKVVSAIGGGTLSPRKLGRLNGEVVSGSKGSCLLWPRGESLWSITAEGESSLQLLEEVAKKWQWTSKN